VNFLLILSAGENLLCFAYSSSNNSSPDCDLFLVGYKKMILITRLKTAWKLQIVMRKVLAVGICNTVLCDFVVHHDICLN